MRLRSEAVTAVAATVTAIAAVVIAAWDNVQTREHNRLSVSPRLTIDLSRSTTPVGTRFAFIVRNDGIGPAIVTDMEIRFDAGDETIEPSEWAPVIRRLEEAGHVVNQFWEFARGDAIAVDRTFTLLGIVEQAEGDSPAPLDETVRRLEIAIDYESVYGDSLRAEYEYVP